MKKILFLAVAMFICTNVWGLELRYTIPKAKVDEYVDDYVYIHKNRETMPDPNWVDPEDGSEAPQILKYTNQGWTKEHIRRYIGNQIRRGKNAKYRDANPTTAVDDVE